MNSLLPSIGRGMLITFLACFFSVLSAQVPHGHIGGFKEHDKCATMFADSVRRSKVPNAPTLNDFENWLQSEIAKQKQLPQNKSGRAAIITIPVIVHVVHNGHAVGVSENISAAQVNSQITILNEDFRRLNADRTSTPAMFLPVAADVEIEFCMALRDPNGQVLAEPGIDRVLRTEANWSNTGNIDAILKPQTIWDPTQYFNIWVVDFGNNGLLGYAQFPEGSGLAGMPTGAEDATTDGVVVLYNAFGNTGNVTSPYNKGRTTTHEVGHWLGLRHIWGDGGCGVDDFCNDTPDHDAENRGCTTGSVSCGTTEMVQNYMDYTNDACMNIFTLDQKTRMQTVMAVSPRRLSLRSSTVCTPLPQASITGQVRDASTLVGVPNARVRLLGVGNNFSYNVITDANGNFTVSVNQGIYNVYGGKWGYVTNVAANRNFNAPTGTVTVDIAKGYYDDFIMDFGWTVTGTATTGDFERRAPVATTYNGAPCNPGADVTTDYGSDAYVTGNNAAGTNAGGDDVDGGTTILTSPVFDLTTYNLPYVSFYRWWINDGGDGTPMNDTLVVRLTNGVTTVVIDRIGPSTNGGNQWVFRNYNIASLITPTANMRLTATTGDYGAGHLVEAGIDLFRVVDSLPVINQPPTPLFTSTTPTICTGQTITFTDQSPGNITSRLWTFQGGTPATSTTASQTVTYNTAGNYSVTLRVTNAFGSDTLIEAGYVTVTTAQTLFTANVTQGCGPLSVQFTDQSSCNPTAWSWSFPGGTPSTSALQNPSITYNTPGTYDVSLTVNGLTTTFSNYVTIGTSGTLLSEDFESNSFATNGWTVLNPDTGITWVINTVAGNAPGTRAAGINLFNYNSNGQRDGLISPVLNLSTVVNTVLSFEHAHRRRTQALRDSLVVYVSVDGGTTWPYRVLAAGENGTGNFATGAVVATNFVPAANTEWCTGTTFADCFTLDLSAFDGQPNVRIKFESYNNIGNNIYLDDIVVTGCQLNPSQIPNATFTATPRTGCGSVTAQYTDQSTNTPTSWQWTFPGGTPSASASQNPSVVYSTPGVYAATLIATNADGADTLTVASYITVNAFPTVTFTTVNSNCGANTGSATAAAAGGVAPYTYAWSNGGTNAAISNVAAGSYTVTITDARGCTATGSATVSQNTPPTVTASKTDASCFGANDGEATVNVSSGASPFTYTWTGGLTSQTITGLAAGTYTVTVTGANNCSITASVNVGQPAPIVINSSVTDATCGNADGTINTSVTGGTPAYNYFWNGGQVSPNQINLASGNYTLTVVDQNGCTADTSILVSNVGGPTVTLTATNNTCNGQTNGTVTTSVSGGASPYTYHWSNGTFGAGLSNLAAGTYTLTVTDANGCVAVRSATVSQPSLLQLQTSQADATCGNPNGEAGVSVSGGVAPYSYLWTNGTTQPLLQNLGEGTYGVTVTDGSGCQLTASVVVDSLPVLSITPIVNDESCYGFNNGNISLVINSGSAPFAFTWANGLSVQTATGLAPGNYDITVSDASGCVNTFNLAIAGATQLNVTSSVVGIVCGSKVGEAEVTVSGGAAPYTYLWSTGDSAANLLVEFEGNFSVTVTDADGCRESASVFIPLSNGPDLTVSSTPDSANTINGTATVVASNGAPFTYEWSDGQTTATATGLAAGVYIVTVTDADGCDAVDSVVVSLLTDLKDVISEVNVSIWPNPTTGKFLVNFTGIVGNATITVYDALGKLIISRENDILAHPTMEMDMGDLAGGVYMVRINHQGQTLHYRLILAK